MFTSGVQENPIITRLAMTQRCYYIADTINGAFEGPLTKAEADERLRFWIDDKIESVKGQLGENGLTVDEIEDKVKQFYSIVRKAGKYEEVAIPGEEWQRINSGSIEWYLNLWAWLLTHDFNPLAESEISDYGLTSLGETINGEMYFEDIESGAIYSGKLGDVAGADGSMLYMFKPYKMSNEIQSSEIR
ncbi:MAG: hypothetical protein HGB22_11320 [Chlorobiaceae bacterium]|nr:hypothetical protein [Chlorobiaceae bacterium]